MSSHRDGGRDFSQCLQFFLVIFFFFFFSGTCPDDEIDLEEYRVF